MKEEKTKKLWYQTGWGIVAIILFLPFFAIWYVWAKTNWSQLVKGIVTAVIVIILIAIGSGSGDSVKTTTSPTDKSKTTQTTTTEQKVTTEVATAKYDIVYTVKGKRYDGAVIYYALLDPINLTTDSFKTDIKKIVDKEVKSKGSKISLEFFDTKADADTFYKEWAEMSLTPDQIKASGASMAIHHVASFSGEQDNNLWKNTLMFYPSTFTDNATVGKYVGSEEYNPQK